MTFRRFMKTVKERFEEKFELIPFHDCWEWTAYKNQDGYGRFFLNGNKVASRISYTIYKGQIPNNLEVRHTCDNPGCVRPEHLILGTHLENMQDCTNRNRGVKGERNGRCKLTEKDVLEIRTKYKKGNKWHPGYSAYTLAKEYNVHPSEIWVIINRKNWKDI